LDRDPDGKSDAGPNPQSVLRAYRKAMRNDPEITETTARICSRLERAILTRH
jgi:hypothetical protein